MAEMTREEAAEVLELLYGDCDPIEENTWQALRMGVATLRGPQADPDTGLVPCGCGGDAVRNGRSFLCAYVTSCSECGTLAWSKASQQEADNNWNTAMGYKEADE